MSAVKERPIIFSAPMVRSLLAGSKSQTRRALNQQPIENGPIGGFAFVDGFWCALSGFDGSIINRLDRPCPYGQPGDRLYVRENAWERPERTPAMMRDGADTWPPFIYDADYTNGIPLEERDDLKTWGWKRRPSIHLPRWASRILLEITDVRVERLNDISEADAIADGCNPHSGLHGDDDVAVYLTSKSFDYAHGKIASVPMPIIRYAVLWDSINGPGSWERNPYVWVLSFRRIAP